MQLARVPVLERPGWSRHTRELLLILWLLLLPVQWLLLRPTSEARLVQIRLRRQGAGATGHLLLLLRRRHLHLHRGTREGRPRGLLLLPKGLLAELTREGP